ncbi:MAG: hypothetical protein IJV81_04845 [Paludibacteraceae bacterium]|nr:hypothetical protein [Paludibacteraceae bacterium]
MQPISLKVHRNVTIIATSERSLKEVFLKNIREARGFEDRGGIAVAQCRRAAVIATSERSLKEVFLKNIREARGFEDRGGIAVA